MSISKPSIWTVGGNVLARSMSQILKNYQGINALSLKVEEVVQLRASYPVPVPMSAILILGLERGMLG